MMFKSFSARDVLQQQWKCSMQLVLCSRRCIDWVSVLYVVVHIVGCWWTEVIILNWQ